MVVFTIPSLVKMLLNQEWKWVFLVLFFICATTPEIAKSMINNEFICDRIDRRIDIQVTYFNVLTKPICSLDTQLNENQLLLCNNLLFKAV